MGWCSQSFYDEIAMKEKREKKDAESVRLDRVVICRVDPAEPKSAELVCPQCGHFPLLLTGRKTMGGPVDRKAFCEKCQYEDEF